MLFLKEIFGYRFQTKLFDEFCVLLTREDLRQSVGGLLRGRDPGDVKAASLDLLSEPVMSDINVLELGIEDRDLTLQQTEGLGVVTADFQLGIRVEVDYLKDSMKPISLPCGVFKCVEFGFCC